MKIAILADIHANIFALKSVMFACQQLKVDHFFILGDLIGYYYWPHEVLTELKQLSSLTVIQGNHERMLHAALDSPLERERIQQKYGSGLNYALEQLSSEWKRWLQALPVTQRIELDGLRFLLCHGAPFHEDRYIYPNADAELLKKCAASHADFIFMGHTHYPFVACLEGVVLANPGSVGQPRDKGDSASFLTLDTQNRSMVFHRVGFDTDTVMQAARQIDSHLDYLWDIFLRNTDRQRERKEAHE